MRKEMRGTKPFGKFATAQRADVGIGPYANLEDRCKKPDCKPSLRSGKEETSLENKKHRFAMIRFGKVVSDAGIGPYANLKGPYGTKGKGREKWVV